MPAEQRGSVYKTAISFRGARRAVPRSARDRAGSLDERRSVTGWDTHRRRSATYRSHETFDSSTPTSRGFEKAGDGARTHDPQLGKRGQPCMTKRFALNHAECMPLETAPDRWNRVVIWRTTGARPRRGHVAARTAATPRPSRRANKRNKEGHPKGGASSITFLTNR